MMTESETVPVMAFSSPQHAQIAQGMLQAQDVSCAITGDQLASTMSMYGPALSRIELWVKAEDAKEATELLRELNGVHAEPDQWSLNDRECWECTGCHEVNQPNFDECWSCSLERAENAQLVAADQAPDAVALETDLSAENDHLNPYRVSGAKTIVVTAPDAEALTKRAFQAAVLGIVFPVPVLFYAAYLSMSCMSSGKHDWRFWIALILSVPTSLAMLMLLLLEFGPG